MRPKPPDRIRPRNRLLIATAGVVALAIVAIEPAAAQEFGGPEQVGTFIRSFFEWAFTIGVLVCAGVAVLATLAYGATGRYIHRAKLAGLAAVGGYFVFLVINSALTAFGLTPLDFAPV